MPYTLLLALSLCLALLIAAPAEAQIRDLPDVEVGRVGDVVLRAAVAVPAEAADKPMPVLIWVHGGGWKGGSYKENAVRGFAADGYFTASLQYRFSDVAQWPAQLDDLRTALKYFVDNAKTYNLDPDRIAIVGASAGGHLVECLATMGAGEGVKIRAVVPFCAPSDFVTGKKVYGWGVGPLLGDKDLTDTEKQKSASPIYHVKAGLPPFLLFHGDADPTVPVDESIRFHAALQKAGVQSELVVVPGGDHGFRGKQGAPPPQPDHNARIEKMKAFLAEVMK